MALETLFNPLNLEYLKHKPLPMSRSRLLCNLSKCTISTGHTPFGIRFFILSDSSFCNIRLILDSWCTSTIQSLNSDSLPVWPCRNIFQCKLFTLDFEPSVTQSIINGVRADTKNSYVSQYGNVCPESSNQQATTLISKKFFDTSARYDSLIQE